MAVGIAIGCFAASVPTMITGLPIGTTSIPNVIGLVNVALPLKKAWYGASVKTCGCSGS